MNDQDKKIVETIKERFPQHVRHAIIRVIVFGSRARGDERGDSDLDVAVIVDRKTPEIERAIDDAVYGVMWDNDFTPIISLKVFQENRFRQAIEKGFSFYRHIDAEGITV